MNKKTDEDLLRMRAKARALLQPAPDYTKPPSVFVVCNVGCITTADDAPRTPNYDWRWAETRPEGMSGPSIQFERAEGESAGDFVKRVLDSLPAVPRGYAIATFSSPNIPESSGTLLVTDTGIQ
jgi:hypothetical protein